MTGGIFSNRLPWLGYPTDIWDSDLTPTQKLIMISIWSFANREGGGAFPSVATLASATGYTPRCVQKSMTHLENKGWIHITHRPGLSSMYEAIRGERGSPRTSFTPERRSPDVMPNVIEDDVSSNNVTEGTKRTRGETQLQIQTKWNQFATENGLKKIQGVLNPKRMGLYRARIKAEPEFWRILGAALQKRSQWYVDQCQPTFDQAVRADYFDEKIRDLGWYVPGEDKRVEQWRPKRMKEAWPETWKNYSLYRRLARSQGCPDSELENYEILGEAPFRR